MMHCGLRHAVAAMGLLALSLARAFAQTPPSVGVTPLPAPRASYHYVDGTRPPDAFLALRTAPSARAGSRMMKMPNGTLLEVIDKRPDGWWRVRVLASGAEGWALSGQGDRTWIYCCRQK